MEWSVESTAEFDEWWESLDEAEENKVVVQPVDKAKTRHVIKVALILFLRFFLLFFMTCYPDTAFKSVTLMQNVMGGNFHAI